MGCGSAIGKAFLVTVNTIFTILGLVLLIIGCIVKFNKELVTKYADELFKVIKLESANLNLDELLSSSAVVFIIVGVVILIVGVLGCLGACCGWRAFLVIYAIIVFLVLIAEIAGVVLAAFMKKDVEKVVKDGLKKSITEFYKGDEFQEPVTLAWNSIFIEFDCCGVDNYMDFDNATNWNKTFKGQPLNLVTPVSCCNTITGEFPALNYPTSTNCATNPQDADSNWKKGCYSAIEDFINKYSNIFIGIGAVVAVFEILCIVFAICVCRSVEEGEKMV
ncbi:CD151 antigen-like [Ostrea edulis]|uniref:CD151 antigen-like n=1 Tax=Ostrea edulis TaxID=37623 RepID=UPI0024AFD16D|nr:CD151 antigen-like [Ostrea edulis]